MTRPTRFRQSLRDRSRVFEWRLGLRLRQVEHRTDFLNFLAAVNDYRSYLEIGVRDPWINFDRVRVPHKVSVDPVPQGPITFRLSSDAFFRRVSESDATESFDLIFIDGLHLAEQVDRDITNSLRLLAPHGSIVVHDCNPQSADAQSTDYDGFKVWNGTVWKAWLRFRATRADLAMAVIDIDYGCGLIRRGSQECYPMSFTSFEDLDYRLLEHDRQRILNLISPRDFLKCSRDFLQPS